MSVTKRCEYCNTISSVTTKRSINGQLLEIITPHKCNRLAYKYGKNCRYCNKHITIEVYENFSKLGHIMNESHIKAKHDCIDENDKAFIDSDI